MHLTVRLCFGGNEVTLMFKEPFFIFLYPSLILPLRGGNLGRGILFKGLSFLHSPHSYFLMAFWRS
jgi:hypothetical protein